MGNVNTITPSGNRYEHGVINKEAVRPGIHLNISALVNEFEPQPPRMQVLVD